MKNAPASGLLVIRLLLGVFLFFEGLDKLPWFTDVKPLTETLNGWRDDAPALSRAYIDAVALPGVAAFARLVPLGELSCGLALVLGVWTRWSALIALFMVLNFHFASGRIFELGFLTNGYGLPVVGSLFGLVLGGGRLPLSVTRHRG